MKKITKKLTLNKETISALDKTQMLSVKGGFTYSLSTGDRCQSVNEWLSRCCGGKDPRIHQN
jgi:natural product precursor